MITKESDELITAKGKKEIRFFRNHKPEAERKHTSVYWQVNLSMQIQDMIDVVNDDRLCDGWNTTALDSHQLTDAANGLYTVARWYWLLAPTAHYPNVCWCFLYVFNNITHTWPELEANMMFTKAYYVAVPLQWRQCRENIGYKVGAHTSALAPR